MIPVRHVGTPRVLHVGSTLRHVYCTSPYNPPPTPYRRVGVEYTPPCTGVGGPPTAYSAA